MNYSTLQEAYNIDTFEKKPKSVQKPNKNNGSMVVSTNTSPSFVETSKLSLNSNKLTDYPNNQGSSCSPLQAPNYNIPVSNECKKEHDDAMNVYTNANNNNSFMMNTFQNNTNKPTLQQPELQPISNPSSTMTSLNYSASSYNNIKGSSDNVMPYYDEDLEQYFNINNLNDEVKYNSHAYMPTTNKQSYTNNDTSQYANNNNIPNNGNNLLNNSSYNLTPEEKKSAEEAILFLKSIEEKINNGNVNSSGYNKTSVLDPVIHPENTGPGGFKTENINENRDNLAKQDTSIKKDANGNNYIYNAIFNISILLIIGIAIILLCDQIVELSIQIGMKRAVNILEPFIKSTTS
jgi:hypothetical protein